MRNQTNKEGRTHEEKTPFNSIKRINGKPCFGKRSHTRIGFFEETAGNGTRDGHGGNRGNEKRV